MFPLQWAVKILRSKSEELWQQANQLCNKFSGKTYRLAAIHVLQTTTDKHTTKGRPKVEEKTKKS